MVNRCDAIYFWARKGLMCFVLGNGDGKLSESGPRHHKSNDPIQDIIKDLENNLKNMRLP
jgi:hypothetical protein